jgi:hypothetical protein
LRTEPALGLPEGVDQLEADAALPAPNEVISLIVHETLGYRNVSCDGARGRVTEEELGWNRSQSIETILTHFLFPPLARLACLGSPLPFVRVDFGASHGDYPVMSY